MTRCELCNKRVWWFQDYKVLGCKLVEEYILPNMVDNNTFRLTRLQKAHMGCIKKYGKKINHEME